MNIIGIIPAVGGIGSTSLAIDLSKTLDNSLLVDFNNGFRTIDIIINESDIIYDVYDLASGIDLDLVVKKTEDFDFIAASQSKMISDFDLINLKEKFSSLNYDNIIIDLPRATLYIKELSEILDTIIIVSNFTDISKRNVEKITFDAFKNNRYIKMGVVLNKINIVNELKIKDFSDNLKFAKILNIIKLRDDFNLFEDIDLNNIIRFINDEEFSINVSNLSADYNIKEENNENRTWLQKIFGK